MQGLTSEVAGDWLGILVNVTVLVGGLAAAYRFRVFDVLGHKYRSEVWCTSTPTVRDGRILFLANYVIHNTGSRPLLLSSVTLSLLEPHPDDEIIDSDRALDPPLVTRRFDLDAGSSWFRIGAGERSIFPLRCYLDELPAPVLVSCTFRWKRRKQPSPFIRLYDPRLPVTWWSEPTPGLPAAYEPPERVRPGRDS